MSALPDPEHPFLTARHVDDMTDAVRALNHRLEIGERQLQQILDVMRRQLEVSARMANSMDDIRDILMRAHSNGRSHAIVDGDP